MLLYTFNVYYCLFLFYVYDCLSTYVTGYYIYIWCPKSSEEGVSSPGSGVMDLCEPPCGCRELNPGPLVEQPVRLTAEPFLPSLKNSLPRISKLNFNIRPCCSYIIFSQLKLVMAWLIIKWWYDKYMMAMIHYNKRSVLDQLYVTAVVLMCTVFQVPQWWGWQAGAEDRWMRALPSWRDQRHYGRSLLLRVNLLQCRLSFFCKTPAFCHLLWVLCHEGP